VKRFIYFIGFLGIFYGVSSCARVSDAWLSSSMAAAAKNQIMLVRNSPPSLGYQRMEWQLLVHPDLKWFTDRQGLPDFLVETGSVDQQYLILYYLSRHEAYACRPKAGAPQEIEMAGPYPMTDHEYRLLHDFMRKSNQASLKP
jgi:hypothetical protein